MSASHASERPKNHHAQSYAACVRTLDSSGAFSQTNNTVGGMPLLGGGARVGMEYPCAKAFVVYQFSQFDRRPKWEYGTCHLRGNSPLPQVAHRNDVAPSYPYCCLPSSSWTSLTLNQTAHRHSPQTFHPT